MATTVMKRTATAPPTPSSSSSSSPPCNQTTHIQHHAQKHQHHRSRGGGSAGERGGGESHYQRLRLYYCFVGAMSWMIGYNLIYPQLQQRHFDDNSPPHRPPLLLSVTTTATPATTTSAAAAQNTFSYQKQPTHRACNDNRGVLHIAMGDIGGAAGTIFFQFVVGQILYAERNNLKPWVHFDNVSYIVFDDNVHNLQNLEVQLKARVGGLTPSIVRRPNGHWRDAIPGPLVEDESSTQTTQTTVLRFPGSTGVWEHYFEPVSDFVPGDSSCETKHYVTLDLELITPGIHGFANWTPKGWRYQYLPDYITRPHIPLTEWLEPQRRIGARVAQQYIHPKPYLIKHAERVNPDCSNTAGTNGGNGGGVICLGMHIRHSDKAAGRRLLLTSEFLPYARAFVHAATSNNNNNTTRIAIYLATDSWKVVQEVKAGWPEDIVSKIRLLDDTNDNIVDSSSVPIIRSKDETAVFDLAVHNNVSSSSSSTSGAGAVGHHVTNQQVLVDILALSRCQFLLHGLSAVSEAAIWMHRSGDIESDNDNFGLHARSVNLEDPAHMTVAEFAALVQMVLRREPRSRWPHTSMRTDPWWKRMWQHEEGRGQVKEVLVDHDDDDDNKPNRDQSIQISSTGSTITTSGAGVGVIPCPHDDPNSPSSRTTAVTALHIATVGNDSSAGAAFFTHILNQLIYAEQHGLVPWIHLEAAAAPNLFDANVHIGNHNNNKRSNSNSAANVTLRGVSRVVASSVAVTNSQDLQESSSSYPGPPNRSVTDNTVQDYTVQGNGIWESYFEPVVISSSAILSISNCKQDNDNNHHQQRSNKLPLPPQPQLSLVILNESQVSPGLDSLEPWSVKAWRYNSVPDYLWWGNSKQQSSQQQQQQHQSQRVSALHMWYEPMRRKGHEIVQKYFRFRPYLLRRAEQVNSVVKEKEPCLAIHFRNGDKNGRYRKKVSADKFLPYMQAFADAGGKIIYVATDSHHILQYMNKNFPDPVRQMIRSQGEYVVRATKERNPNAKGYPTHFIAGEEDHHRVNAETLVDILAMSKCRLLLHTYSTVAEAAIYLNLDLHNNSVNLEDPEKISPEHFRKLVSRRLKQFHEDMAGTRQGAMTIPEVSQNGVIEEAHLDNATILRRQVASRGKCRTNAIVYLAQKQHSSYGRDSYKTLLRSLDLLYKYYLSEPSYMDNADIYIFHTGDFNESDLVTIESHLGSSASRGAVNLVDLSKSPYWARPRYNAKDDPGSWYAFPLFSEGYRRMMHWYAIDIWNFFRDWNVQSGCKYRYIFRLDEDSYIHSPIPYDIFDLFETNQYVYGFRLCAYEMKVSQRMWNLWKRFHPEFAPQRKLDLEMCGFYNNMFVADLKFFTSPQVSKFLKFVDQQGHIYRRRLGDLMIHTMSVIAFAPPERIHRFLDFTYEHGTLDKDTGCLTWGGIQVGYNDPNASLTLNQFYQTMLVDRGCPGNITFLHEPDLSPTYSHIPPDWRGGVSLHTVVAGWVETSAGKGILSG